MTIDDLGDVHDLVLQHLDDVLVLGVHVVLVACFRYLAEHRPDLPRHALWLEGPARPTLLEELEADGAARGRRRAVHSPQQLGEVRDLALHVPPEQLRLATHVREVDKIAVHIDITDSPDRVALLAVVSELAAGAVEQHRVEDAGDDLVHLPPLHRQFERDGPSVHVPAVSVPAPVHLLSLST